MVCRPTLKQRCMTFRLCHRQDYVTQGISKSVLKNSSLMLLCKELILICKTEEPNQSSRIIQNVIFFQWKECGTLLEGTRCVSATKKWVLFLCIKLVNTKWIICLIFSHCRHLPLHKVIQVNFCPPPYAFSVFVWFKLLLKWHLCDNFSKMFAVTLLFMLKHNFWRLLDR